jgi:hypothetical protein
VIKFVICKIVQIGIYFFYLCFKTLIEVKMKGFLLTLAKSLIPEIMLGIGIVLLKQSTEELSDSCASVLCCRPRRIFDFDGLETGMVRLNRCA